MAVDVMVPPLGTTVDTLTLIAWYRNEGDTVVKGDPLFCVETDKATLDVEAPGSGRLIRISAKAGDVVQTLTRIAVIVGEGETTPAADTKLTTLHQPAAARITSAVAPTLAPKVRAITDQSRNRILISPRAKRFAQDRNLEWKTLRGTGPEGAIVERDVRDALKEEPAAQSPVTLTSEVDATELMLLLERINHLGTAATIDDLMLMILAQALSEARGTNCPDEAYDSGLHIGLTVETKEDFVVAPVLNVDTLSLRTIVAETARIRDAALIGNIDTADVNQIAACITNLGSFCVDTFTPTMPVSQCPLIGIGRIKRHTSAQGDSFSLWLSLTYDPSKIRALAAAKLVQTVVTTIENPLRALL